jgi:hypothetical protein
MSQAPWPFDLATSELALDRAPGNQLFLFRLSAAAGGLPSLGGFDWDRAWTGLDTAREPSAATPRAMGGWAETLRPRGFGAGDVCRGWSRFGWSFAADGGCSGEGLLSARLPLGGVACVAVTAGRRDGVPSLVRTVGGGGGGEEGIAGTL